VFGGDDGDRRFVLSAKAVRTRRYSKETELVSDSNHQLITNWLVTRFRTRSHSIVTETASLECMLTYKAELFSLCSHDVKY
jgi:hypothetical protein